MTTAGVTAGFVDEAAEAGDDSPDLAQVDVPVGRAHAFVGYSIEAGSDIPNFVEEVTGLLLDAKDVLEGSAFTTGDGVAPNPQGIVTGVAAVAGSVVDVASVRLSAIEDVYTLAEDVPPRGQPMMRWMASLPIINSVRQFASGTGPSHAFWADLGEGTPPLLLGKPIHENSSMTSVLTTGSNIAVAGDFKQFGIVDRAGATVEPIPHLFGANRRPTGERGLYLWWRTGSKVLVPELLRVLQT